MTNKWATQWDERHRQASDLPEIAYCLGQFSYLLPPQGTALDFACGLGANGLWLARNNFAVSAWDFSDVALERLRIVAQSQNVHIKTQLCDVTQTPLPPDTFDVIVVSRFLHRPSAPLLMAALRSKGLLFYETFTRHKHPDIGPSNPDFLLEENELLHLFNDLVIRAYGEAGLVGDLQQGLRNLAYLVGQKS